MLGDKLTLNDVRSTISNLIQRGEGVEDEKLKALNDVYRKAMERINGQMEGRRTLAMNVLSWITQAKRQLTKLELQHALTIKAEKNHLDADDLPDNGDMISVCAGLATVDIKSDIIRLVHYTTQEYLTQTREQWFPNAESIIATACVNCLSFDSFSSGACIYYSDLDRRLQRFPFYNYAARNWGFFHACQMPKLSKEVLDLLKCERKI
jgi:hypothetical protein